MLAHVLLLCFLLLAGSAKDRQLDASLGGTFCSSKSVNVLIKTYSVRVYANLYPKAGEFDVSLHGDMHLPLCTGNRFGQGKGNRLRILHTQPCMEDLLKQLTVSNMQLAWNSAEQSVEIRANTAYGLGRSSITLSKAACDNDGIVPYEAKRYAAIYNDTKHERNGLPDEL
mmetsp:Transcript_48856/g.80300  ORF Transcript_48856/g.80300 Transcript_48856/m.80300 type:complete len:170 (-) Transcript_48856:202-711(-)